MFAVAMHGMELCFLQMGEFVRDARRYVHKQPRTELLARDVIAQCARLLEVRAMAWCVPAVRDSASVRGSASLYIAAHCPRRRDA